MRRNPWVAFLLAVCAWPVGEARAAEEGAPAGELGQRFEIERPAMGTLFRVVVYAPGEQVAATAVEAALARVARLDEILSDYNPESELCLLSSQSPTPQAVPVRDDLFRVLAVSQTLAEKTDGAFDITAGPLTRLWRQARRSGELPPASELAAARAATGWQKLKLDSEHRTAQLSAARMRLDLGGIAKGHAADEALAVLRRHGICRALVAASGDLALGDPPPGKSGWEIGLAPPSANALPTVRLSLANCGVSTSGDTFQHVVIGGVRYSHIVNPQTGLGLTEPLVVSVIAPNCATSDPLATAICVLGVERGLKLAEQETGVAALAVMRKGEETCVYRSPRFERIEREAAAEPGNAAPGP